MIETFKDIAFIITPIITTVGVAFLTYKGKMRELAQAKELATMQAMQKKTIEDNNKELNNKLNVKFDKIIDRQQQLEIGFFDLKENVMRHMGESDSKEYIENGIKLATEDEALRMIKSNFIIGTNRKSMLTKWGSLMKNFAKDFFKNETRKENELRRAEVLDEYQALITSDFNNYINQKIVGVKLFKNNKSRFSDFIEKLHIYASFENLIIDLKRNNLTEKEYVEKFQIQVNTFCRALIIAQSEWLELQDSSMFDKKDVA